MVLPLLIDSWEGNTVRSGPFTMQNATCTALQAMCVLANGLLGKLQGMLTLLAWLCQSMLCADQHAHDLAQS